MSNHLCQPRMYLKTGNMTNSERGVSRASYVSAGILVVLKAEMLPRNINDT